MKSFLEKIFVKYGNPDAVFANHIVPGQKVKIILDGEIENLIAVRPARALGKNRYLLLWGGRKWKVKIPHGRVLVAW